MRVFVVLAHPKKDSFNAALCSEFCRGLREAGHDPDLADLYAEGFNPVLCGQELDTLGNGRPLQDVGVYQQRILQAQAMAFFFPIWWFGVPAILKGFVDRVFQEGFAFSFTSEAQVRGLLRQTRALVVCTAGAGAPLYRHLDFSPPLKKIFAEWTLQSCGIRRVRHVVFYELRDSDAAVRARHLQKAKRLGREFFSPGSSSEN